MRQGRHRILTFLLLAAAVPAAADVYDKLAAKLIKELAADKDAKAAVLPFAYADGRSSAGGVIVSEALATAIAEKSGALLVERNQLESALKEISLGYTGMISTTGAVQAGKIAGARFLILGSLADEEDSKVSVLARVIETESGLVRTAAKATVRKTWRDAPNVDPSGKALAVNTVQIPIGEAKGLRVETFGDRTVKLEYLNTDGGAPKLRLTDITRPEAAEFDTVELPLDAQRNTFTTLSPAKAKLAGRRYLVWSGVWKPDVGPTLHVAPLKGFFSSTTVPDQEILITLLDLTDRWVREVQSRGHFLGNRSGLDLVAYYERLPHERLRVSVWEIDVARNLARVPARSLVIQGKKGAEAASPITDVGVRHFRFHYDVDQDRVTVEEL